jgi:signal transduction histidine kinase/DNA-binding response OmpR family regulator
MKNLKVWKKLALIGLVFLVPSILAMVILVRQLNRDIRFLESEPSGVVVTDHLLEIVHRLQLLRALKHLAMRGQIQEERLKPAQNLLREKLARMNELSREAQFANHFAPSQPAFAVSTLANWSWPQIEAECRRLLDSGEKSDVSGIATVDELTRVIEMLLAFISDVGDRSNLTLDSEPATYYLQNILLVEGPLSIELLTQARALTPALLWPATEEERTNAAQRVGTLLQGGAMQEKRTAVAIEKARRDPLTASARLDELRASLTEASERALREMRELLGTRPPDVKPPSGDEFAAQAEASLRQAYALQTHLSSTLTKLLQQRIEERRNTRNTAVGLSAAGVFLAGMLGLLLMRDMTIPIGVLATAAREIASGEPDAKVDVGQREDELGELAEAFQRMIEKEKEHRHQLVVRNLEMLEAREVALHAKEEAIEAKDRAEAADHAKRDFLAVMSHEMRTPLNGIIPVAELLAEGRLDDGQREHIKTIRSSAEHLLMLLNDVLDFSKIEAGRLELENVSFELRELLGETVQILAARAVEAGLELNFHVKPDVPDDLIGDPHRIRQVVVNLVGNALKFTHEGEVNLFVEVARPEDDEGIVLRFQVRDSGIGISPEAQNRLFSAFEQADRSTTRRYGGSGLGLAICKKLVQAMGGDIAVESEIGKGSVFSFTAALGVVKANFDVTVWNDLPKARILAVDDSATNRMILRELLQAWGMKIEEASRAGEGLELMRKAHGEAHPFDLVITDMMMPDCDGFEFIGKIRADAALRNTRVMMLTSANLAGDRERARALGIITMLTKPIRQAILMDSVAEAFGQKRRSKHTAAIDPQQIPDQRPLRILLVEDNATNQRIARLNLESWGHHVTIAEDGVEAVDRTSDERFDLILMDSQMPRMNGLEATQTIRSREKPGARAPIIAMTANVIEGFREECLAAGMDGFVTKPIRRDALVKEMIRFIPDLLQAQRAATPPPETVNAPSVSEKPAEDPASAEPLFDRTALLDATGDSEETFREILRLALNEDFPRLEAMLDEASATDDLAAFERAAHAIKGLVSELKAAPCRAAATAVEEAVVEEKLPLVAARAAKLKIEFEKLRAALRAAS